MALNLGSLLAHSAPQHADRTALIRDDERWSYAALDDSVRRFAACLLTGGLERGEKVAIMAPNGPAFTMAYFGVLYAGGVVVSLNTLQTADEVTYQLADSGAKRFVLHASCIEAGAAACDRVETCTKLYIADGSKGASVPRGAASFEEALAHKDHADVAQTGADETAVILYTSGTTGHPKGAELTHFNLYSNAQFVSERAFSIWPDTINVLGPGHVGIAALPLYHSFGQTNIQNGMLFAGVMLLLELESSAVGYKLTVKGGPDHAEVTEELHGAGEDGDSSASPGGPGGGLGTVRGVRGIMVAAGLSFDDLDFVVRALQAAGTDERTE